MTYSEPTRNTATASLPSKHSSSQVFYLRHGKDQDMATLADYTFTSVVFQDGTEMKDCTFEQLSKAVWGLISKS